MVGALTRQLSILSMRRAMQVKVRRQGAVRATTVLIAVGISKKGYREVALRLGTAGMKVSYGEMGLAWKGLFDELEGGNPGELPRLGVAALSSPLPSQRLRQDAVGLQRQDAPSARQHLAGSLSGEGAPGAGERLRGAEREGFRCAGRAGKQNP